MREAFLYSETMAGSLFTTYDSSNQVQIMAHRFHIVFVILF